MSLCVLVCLYPPLAFCDLTYLRHNYTALQQRPTIPQISFPFQQQNTDIHDKHICTYMFSTTTTFPHQQPQHTQLHHFCSTRKHYTLQHNKDIQYNTLIYSILNKHASNTTTHHKITHLDHKKHNHLHLSAHLKNHLHPTHIYTFCSPLTPKQPHNATHHNITQRTTR